MNDLKVEIKKDDEVDSEDSEICIQHYLLKAIFKLKNKIIKFDFLFKNKQLNYNYIII